MGWLLVLIAALAFAGLSFFAWKGTLGLAAIGLLFVAGVCYFLGRRGLGDTRKSVDLLAKVLFTIVGIMALLRHPIEIAETGARVPLYEAIATYVGEVDTTTFVLYAVVAMAVKFVGVITSAYAWHLLLVGQGIRFPFWQKIMTSFLIGRFIGTFLPSTIGLDGYTLYEAVRYSNEGTRAVTAKALEKFIGITGLFLGMILTMPFGYSVIVHVTAELGSPDAAPLLAAAILAVAGGVSGVVVLGLVRPGVIIWAIQLLSGIAGKLGGGGVIVTKVVGVLERFTQAVGAYHGKVGLLMLTLLAKFVTHFTTFAVYYFTGLAIGVVGLQFWPVVFGSSIQVLATVLSPTIAGEGAREAFQALLLSSHYGGVAQAVLAGALGFIAAEAATMWGGIFLWTRSETWRPAFAEVDGEQVDYAWLQGDAGGFDADKVAAIHQAAKKD